jgi:hypothetical protein
MSNRAMTKTLTYGVIKRIGSRAVLLREQHVSIGTSSQE